ncbi:hypothetical protein [Vibrio lentus]|uniref:DUF1240 domain-containing protein n=1 Tax=Vibrio lentus TaxID=136468 RepID=A0A2N7BVN2_9VIBR|nr:hypothetical protein [Vibrio lentus]PME55786.1 hypothetical protein BCV34_03445 [Vibrio lentus]PME64562.1 hypothetical protein BCV30_08200 [Vibrio lentus]PME87609.1 hypothetical protein BCV27_06250 [Vibrio lentus]
MNKEDTIKTNAWFLFFTLFLCYSIFIWPKVMADKGDVYFFSTASFSITIFFFTFLSPYFIYFNYNLLTGNANKDLSSKVSIFILALATLAPVYPSFMYYSDLDTLKTQHSEYYCGAEIKIGRSMPLLEKFSFNKQCGK